MRNLLTKYILRLPQFIEAKVQNYIKTPFMKHIGQPGVGAFALANFMLVGWLSQARGLRTPKSKQVEVDFLVKNPDEFLLLLLCMMVFSIKKK